MYVIVKKKKKLHNVIFDTSELVGFKLNSRKKAFCIDGVNVSNIVVYERKIVNRLAYNKVLKKYNKLIKVLTDLFISDDDSGESFRLALNEMEKFRLEVKNKYRIFLTKKDLEYMSLKLSILKKQAQKSLDELIYSYENTNRNSKGR